MAELPLRLPESDRPTVQGRGSRMVTFSFSVPKLVFSLLFMAAILVWVFIFGIMLGRGHKPEKVVPELARVMPVPQAQNATSPVQTTADAAKQSGNQPLRASAGAATGQNGTRPAAAATPQPSGVLTPQELMYHDTLKGRPTASPLPATAPPKPAQAKTAAKTQAAKADAKKQTTKAEAKVQSPKPEAKTQAAKPAPVPTKTAAAPPVTPPASPAKKTTDPVFNYVYQVAAFKDMPSAEAMRKKLQAAGVTTRIEKDNAQGTAWYKLLASFKGRPEDTRSLRQKLTDQGIPRGILRSKTPAP